MRSSSYRYAALKDEDSGYSTPIMYGSPGRYASSMSNRRARIIVLVALALGSFYFFAPESITFSSSTGDGVETAGANIDHLSTSDPQHVVVHSPGHLRPEVKNTWAESDVDGQPLLSSTPPAAFVLGLGDDDHSEMPSAESSAIREPTRGPYMPLSQANISPYCKNPGSVPEYSRDSPFIVTGTAGTGTRVLYEILHANNITMPSPMNEERDNLRFILSVKQTTPFGVPGGQSQHTLLRSVNGLDYDIDDVLEPARSELRQKSRLALDDIWADSKRDLQGGQPIRWGFKEPHSMFVLPFLHETAPNMTIVHVIRDGRDVALSRQQRMKYQRFYQQEFVRPLLQDNATEREISLAAARLWMKVNLETKAWAEKHIPCRYYIIRLEDLCDPDQTLPQIQRLFDQLHVPYTEETLKSAASSVLYDRCRLEKFRAESPDLIHDVEDLIAPALTAFGYELNKLPRTTDVASTQYPGLRSKLESLTGVGRRVTLTTVNDNYLTTALNWAAFYAANVVIKDASTPPLMIATPSRTVYEQLTERGFPAYYAPMPSEQKPGQYYSYWRWRVGLLNAMVQMGFSTLITDADAIWKQDIWRLSSDEADGLEQMGDIVASRGVASTMPVAIRPPNVASLCMGLAYFSASEASRNVMANVHHLIERARVADDQVITNQVLSLSHQMRFGDDAYKYGTTWSTGSSNVSELQVTLIPHQIVPRDCTHLHPELYRNGATADSALSERFPEAAAYHCRSGKDGANKMSMMQDNQAWRLRADWETRWSEWPQGQPWYLAIRTIDAWVL